MLLTVLDRHWREHLYEMDYLQEGIGLRAIGQRDPLVEYQREGFDMFVAMQDSIKREAVAYVFNASIQVVDEDEERRQAPTPQPTQLTLRRHRSRGARRRHPAPTPRRQEGRPQPALPLRLRQEIQALPRRRHPPPLARPPPRRRRPEASSLGRRHGDRRSGAGAERLNRMSRGRGRRRPGRRRYRAVVRSLGGAAAGGGVTSERRGPVGRSRSCADGIASSRNRPALDGRSSFQ